MLLYLRLYSEYCIEALLQQALFDVAIFHRWAYADSFGPAWNCHSLSPRVNFGAIALNLLGACKWQTVGLLKVVLLRLTPSPKVWKGHATHWVESSDSVRRWKACLLPITVLGAMPHPTIVSECKSKRWVARLLRVAELAAQQNASNVPASSGRMRRFLSDALRFCSSFGM